MIGQTNFLKKVEPKKKTVALNIDQLRKESKSSHSHRTHHIELRKQFLPSFQMIGNFDKKVLVTYSNDLQMFAFFDLHAIHQRIRYEFYTWTARKTQNLKALDHCFDSSVIEKEGKRIRQIFDKPIQALFQVKSQFKILFQENLTAYQAWGISLQRNRMNEVYVTSFRPLLGKQWNSRQIHEIIQSLIQGKQRTPKVIDDWIGQYSCKSAYKFNDDVPLAHAKLLIENLSKCEFPWHCVHGRNTVHVKSAMDLTFK